MARMTGARFLAETLEGYGVTHLFHVPTVLLNTLIELERSGGVKRIVCHDEKAAAYMADGFARVARRPGLCMAQQIGSVNLAAGLRDPYMGCSPVIAISGGPYPFTRHRNTYQEIDGFPVFEPVTKFNAQVDSLDRVPDLLRQAFRAATSGKPRPAHLQLVGHLAELDAEEADLEVVVDERFSRLPAFRPEPEPEAVTEALRALAEAERPVIVAGGGVRWSGASRRSRHGTPGGADRERGRASRPAR
jgi:acetolactate synthase-1/2/3 large subunit